MAVFELQPELCFQQLKLPALKAGSRPQHVAEIEEVHRRHCFQDIYLVHQYTQNDTHPV
jgi:predicted RNase H-like nuclease